MGSLLSRSWAVVVVLFVLFVLLTVVLLIVVLLVVVLAVVLLFVVEFWFVGLVVELRVAVGVADVG